MLTVLILISLFIVAEVWRVTRYRPYTSNKDTPGRLYIYPHDSWEGVMDSIERVMERKSPWELGVLLKMRAPASPPVGSYQVRPSTTTWELYHQLTRGKQSPISLTISSERVPQRLYAKVSKQILADSLSIASCLGDTTYLNEQGLAYPSLAYYILPDTYEVYWTISAEEFRSRMKREWDKFWNRSRLALADSLGLRPEEVTNLAAIVQEESAKRDEYPNIAGLYIHRLRIGMPLQADPTIKYALGDFSLRRILHSHLSIDSPYNTYLHTGLTPTPIRIPYGYTIDGVLHAKDKGYLYMCAKEDFSGYHVFARTYQEHLANARRYTQALNERQIK